MVMSIGRGNLTKAVPVAVKADTFTPSVYHLVGVRSYVGDTNLFLTKVSLMCDDFTFWT